MTSFSGRLADVGDVGGIVYPEQRVNASERLCLGHPFLKHHLVRGISGGDQVLWGKVRKPLQSVQSNHV